MKILTVFGTRPEIIRLSVVIKELDSCVDQILVHTGQNYDPLLSDVFLTEMGIRSVNYNLGVQAATVGQQVGQILERIDKVIEIEKPDRLLILGDTNSGLAAIIAARRRIPVYHMEAGNRCYDNRVPEETNRRIIDHCSDILLPYTNRSAENLVREGISRERIFVTGNPIYEVIKAYQDQIGNSLVLDRLGIQKGSYFLATIHRAENVDSSSRLTEIISGIQAVAEHFNMKVILSVHPRTENQMLKHGVSVDSKKISLQKPFGFFDFVALEMNAKGILTDSGTVQEEACIFGIPNITIRDVTERPETSEAGSNYLSGASPELILIGMKMAVADCSLWVPPVEYTKLNVSKTVAKILLSYRF